MSNGILAGLVSITSVCSSTEPWAALVCGCVGGIVYYNAVALLEKLRIDDVVLAIPVHCFCGACAYLDLLPAAQARLFSFGNLSYCGVGRGCARSWAVVFTHVYLCELWEGK